MKIGKPNILRIIRVLGVAGIMVMLYFSIQMKANSNIKNINIVLESKTKRKLVEKEDILKYLNKALDKDLEIEKIDKVEISEIEYLMDKSKYIKNSEVYLDSKNNLHIHCVLRDPIVRISRRNGKDFYLDSDGNPIPISRRAAIRVPIITGNIKVRELSEIKKKGNTFHKILELSKKINSDQFLNALIEQIYIDNNNRLTIIPKLGRQKIEFGKLNKIDNKLARLKTFYKAGMPSSGWANVEKLNLDLTDQVVITKRN